MFFKQAIFTLAVLGAASAFSLGADKCPNPPTVDNVVLANCKYMKNIAPA